MLRQPLRLIACVAAHALCACQGTLADASFDASASEASSGPARVVGNPFVGTLQYVNPEYTHDTEISAANVPAGSADAAAIATVGKMPTAIWLDTVAAISGGIPSGSSFTLADHLDAAVAQGLAANKPASIMLVIYDLPNRDCAALASNGEFHGTAGLASYKSQYIDAIARTIASKPEYADLRVILVMEPDSLPNLVTNTSLPACAEVANENLYIDGVTYAVETLGALPNVYIYLDIAHSGWLGWPSSMNSAVQLYSQFIKTMRQAGTTAVRGFATNTANYTPLVEPYLSPSDQNVLGSSFYQWNPCFDELTYIKALTTQFQSAGLGDFGFIVDTSRNGWPIVNDGQPIDRRKARGNWCNVAGTGFGEPPQAAPSLFAQLDAYVWVKPPGQSDGISYAENPNNEPDSQGKRFDPSCDPSNPSLSALPGAPSAGGWFDAEFMMLLHNATPAISPSASASAPTPAPTP